MLVQANAMQSLGGVYLVQRRDEREGQVAETSAHHETDRPAVAKRLTSSTCAHITRSHQVTDPERIFSKVEAISLGQLLRTSANKPLARSVSYSDVLVSRPQARGAWWYTVHPHLHSHLQCTQQRRVERKVKRGVVVSGTWCCRRLSAVAKPCTSSECSDLMMVPT